MERWRDRQTGRLIGGLTDRSKNRHTDEQLIDQTYIWTDRDMLEGLTRESTDKNMEQTDRMTKRLAVRRTHGQIERRSYRQQEAGGQAERKEIRGDR